MDIGKQCSPDQTPKNVTYDQDFHSLHTGTCISIRNKIKNLCIPYRFKTKICFGCTFMYYMQVLSVPSLCNEGIVNIQVLCSIQ